ncbi:hypothetical protein [Lutispora saccharofermentans]|uniref:Carboxypeptidase regulatory-like domain-containing protein n=1 Tax=Lutispora saccharofermentans TaxID=3024236 RepID=A0ABT1NGB5_9FIRM|nr:hypothetical protein [Lutispora saccharofermentans]MCQ1529188.1 hypothetical protein [Lutispora saccharofermentans]
MYKHNRNTALLISLVLIFSIMLSPFSAAYASGPAIKTPTITAPLRRLETPARIQGVQYEFKDEVKRIPASMEYDFKPLSLDKFASFDLKPTEPSIGTGITPPTISLPGGATAEPASPAAGENELSIDKINGIRYPAGSKILAIPQSAASSFKPNVNDIYVDEKMGSAFRVLDNQDTDSVGNPQYIVETPELTDVFKSYAIPEQTIDLTTGNIAYIAPEFELSSESGMSKNYVAAAGVSDYVSFRQEGNKHILTLKPGVTIFEYPSKEEQKADKEAKEKERKEKFKGDWWEKDQHGDLRGVENESSLSVDVKVKGGTITIEDPKFHAYFDLNPLTTHVEADFYFDAKATADVTLDGDVTFNKTIEKCVYGYDIDLGKVLGDEKGNKAFVGIFLVIGVEGKIHVEVRTITTGDARAGFAYKAFGYGSIPYFVGPYAAFKPASFDMSFTVNGEINTTLACVPQVGVIIWGKELGALQIWVGFKSRATFSASGGGGSGGAQDFKASGSISLDAFGELVGYLLGDRYSIFYIDYPLYKGEWSVGEEASGSGGDMVREVAPHMIVLADAYTNTIEGKILFDTTSQPRTGYAGDNADIESAKRPYANGRYEVEVWEYGRLKYTIPGLTDAEGHFKIQDSSRYSIVPTDKVIVKIENSPIFEADQKKYKVVGNSKDIQATVPFSKLDFNVDSFNDIITGRVSGNYTGPVRLTIQDNNFQSAVLNVNAVNGIFTYAYPIDENIYNVNALINFEGSKFPDNQGVTRNRNIDSLTINIYNDFKPMEGSNAAAGMQERKITLGRSIDSNISLPSSITNAQDRLDRLGELQGQDLTEQDIEGSKFIKPTKVFGSITNKGDMGWIQNQGDEYVRPGTNSSALKHYNGNIKITSIQVQSALEAMLEDMKGPHDNWLPKPKSDWVPWTATVQAQQAMWLKSVKDASSPIGFRIEQIPTSASQFEFDKPDVVAYVIEIEHEGLKLTKTYDPYSYHYNNNQQTMEDFIGPLKEAVTLVTEEKIDSIVNPGDVMNQWQGAWMTQMGIMELIQKGTSITGSILQGSTAYMVEGTILNGVFKGSIMMPSETSMFGDIVTFEMDMDADGKSANFKNIGAGVKLKNLNGTKAIKR